jgi:uncharacterized surface protein with fasciclin (FAS1) repeats
MSKCTEASLSPTFGKLILAPNSIKTILTYHVVSGKVLAADAAKLKTAKTLQGQELKIDAARWHLHKNMKINDANIIKADVLADNGVIHVIDKVLLPK